MKRPVENFLLWDDLEDPECLSGKKIDLNWHILTGELPPIGPNPVNYADQTDQRI
jgi:hypothetical protein